MSAKPPTTIPTLYSIFHQMEQCCDAEVERLLPLASPERREKALAYRHLQGRYACLKSYAMLCDLLREAGAIAPDEKPLFGYGPHEKPFLRELPGVEFSISHCAAAIAVAVSSQPVGIDVERFRTPSPSLLRYTMNEQEQRQIKTAADFTELWTKKEALAKLTGLGLTSDLRDMLTHKSPDIILTSALFPEKDFAVTIAHTAPLQRYKA
ncbi:MAG: 4'-phosphopantetheinyl transferase superfamily protein [Bacteroidales bacterium]|nr:4'-phosphopantetheinyl transferase superfamily protein [Bacteroidales bacterium]